MASSSTPIVKDEPMEAATDQYEVLFENTSLPEGTTPPPREPHPLDAAFDLLFDSDEFADDNVEASATNGHEANGEEVESSLERDNGRLLPLPPADAPTEAEIYMEEFRKWFPPIRAGEYDPWAGYAYLGLKKEPPILHWEGSVSTPSTSADAAVRSNAKVADNEVVVTHEVITLDEDVENLGQHLTTLSIDEMKEKLATRAERLKKTGTTFEQGRILEDLCDQFAQFHVEVFNNSNAEATPIQLAEQAYATIVQPEQGELEEEDRQGLLQELKTSISQMIDFRNQEWDVHIAPTPYNPMNLAASKRPRQIVVDELARHEVDQLRTRLDQERKEAYAKGVPMRKLTPREIRIFTGRHCTEGWEPSNGRFSREVQMEKARLYFSFNRPKKQPEDDDDDDEDDVEDLDTVAVDPEAEKDEEMEPSGAHRRQTRPVERRKSRRQEIAEEVTRGMFLHRDGSHQAVPVDSLITHIILPEEREHTEARKRDERRARSAERAQRTKELTRMARARSAERAAASRAQVPESSPSPPLSPPPSKRPAVASTSRRPARPVTPAPVQRRPRPDRPIRKESGSSHWDISGELLRRGPLVDRDGSTVERATTLDFCKTSDGGVVERVALIARYGMYSASRNTEGWSGIRPLPTDDCAAPEEEPHVSDGIFIPSHDSWLRMPKGCNPDKPFRNAVIRQMECARHHLNKAYRDFARTARAFKRRNIHKLIIADGLLARFDDTWLDNAYLLRADWPRMPAWIVEEITKVEDDEQKLTQSTKKRKEDARFPQQINTIFVALGLDLLWGYHDKDPSGTWFQVRKFFEDFRTALADILAYPLNEEDASKHEFYKKDFSDWDGSAVKMKKHVFHQGLKLVAITIPEEAQDQFVNMIVDFNVYLRQYVEKDERECLDDVPIVLLDWAQLVKEDKINNPQKEQNFASRLSVLLDAMREDFGVRYVDPHAQQ